MRLAKLVVSIAFLCACVETQESDLEEIDQAEQASGSFTFSTHEVFDTSSSIPLNAQRGTDPFVRIASNGDIYVAATGYPNHPLFTAGGSLWRSTDDGATWAFLGDGPYIDYLGLEPAMHIDGAGRLWMAEFHLGPSVEQIYRFSTPSTIVDRATAHDGIGLGTPPGERPWVSSYGNRIHVQYGEALIEPGVRVSLDGSANPPVFTPTIPIAQNPALRAEILLGTNTSTNVAGIGQGPLAVNQSTGRMCAPLVTLNGPTTNYMPTKGLWTACSNDGLVWANTLVYTPAAGVSVMNFWPASAVDAGGNMYFIVAANMDATGAVTSGMNIFLFSSTDGGVTWSGPKRVNQVSGTNLFPVAVGGCNGGIGIVWYGTSTAANPQSMPSTAEWRVYMAQSKNATAASPTWSETDVAGQVVHYGPRNHKGSFNSGVDYRVIALPGLTIDADGVANVIWQDTTDPWSTNPNASPLATYMGNPTFSEMFHSRQTAGPTLNTCP